MNFKRAFLFGAVIGMLIAVILFPNAPYNGFLFNHMSTGEGLTIAFRLCPFCLSMLFMRSLTGVIVISIIGNAILYGLLAMLCFLLYKSVRWVKVTSKQ
jgi:ABC-type methionine transport system permease subunit